MATCNIRLVPQTWRYGLGILLVTYLGFSAKTTIIQTPTTTEACTSESTLDIFESDDFLEASLKYPVIGNNCVKTNYTKPGYTICVHDPAVDFPISAYILGGRGWETPLSQLLVYALSVYDNAVLVDAGANLGVHTLAAAAAGYNVWAVEALQKNLVKLYRSVELSNFVDRVRLVHNALDMKPGNVSMAIGKNNNVGASRVKPMGKNSSREFELARAVTLRMVIDDIIKQWTNSMKPIPIVIKMDIELYECRTLLGSPDVFSDRNIFVPYVVMEWIFRSGLVQRNPACPRNRLIKMTRMLTDHGYDPYWVRKKPIRSLERLDPAGSDEWRARNVMWKHRDAPDLSQSWIEQSRETADG